MIILSLDSGLEKTGYAIFKKNKSEPELLISGLIKTARNKTTDKRIEEIYLKLKETIIKYKPAIVVVEKLFFNKNIKTAIAVAQTQGIIFLLAAQHSLKLEFLSPLEIKKIITGYGFADKQGVRKMLEMTLKIDKKIKEDDEVDAIACGAAYCYLSRV